MMNTNFVLFMRCALATETTANVLREKQKDYVVRLSGGNDRQDFPMKQGVLNHSRVCLLFSNKYSYMYNEPGFLRR